MTVFVSKKKYFWEKLLKFDFLGKYHG